MSPMSPPPEPPEGEEIDCGAGSFAYQGLLRVLHEKARLGIVTALSTRSEGWLFGELKTMCSLTDGNLHRHLKVLVEDGIVTLRRRNAGRAGQTRVRLTPAGRDAFREYLDELERVLRDARMAMGSELDSDGEGTLQPA